MSQCVDLILFGDFETGFHANLKISEDGKKNIHETGKLPANSEIPNLFEDWKNSFYNRLGLDTRKLEPINNEKPRTFSGTESKEEVQTSFDNWLNSVENRQVIRCLYQHLKSNKEIRLRIGTENQILRQIPWFAWKSIFENYTLIESSIIHTANLHEIETKSPLREKIRILVVLGGSHNNLKLDEIEEFNKLEILGAEIQVLQQPTLKELFDALWDKQGCDIFCFAGHSSSDKNGQIAKFQINNLNNDDEKFVTINDFTKTFRSLIQERGLQLAIFNSCDGLGLAYQLADLGLPQIIFMQEPIPNEVAISFLKHFLQAFAHDKESFYASMRIARHKLELYEKKYPGIGWVPRICENIEAEPLTWKGLCEKRGIKEYNFDDYWDKVTFDIDEDEFEEEYSLKKLKDFQKDVYIRFDELNIHSIDDYQNLAPYTQSHLNEEILSKITAVGGSGKELLEQDHVNTRFTSGILKNVLFQGYSLDILHRKTAMYSDHSLICLDPIIKNQLLQEISLDKRAIHLLLQHRSLIELGKMSIVPEKLSEIKTGDKAQQETIFDVKKLGTVKVDLRDSIIRQSFLSADNKIFKREGMIVFQSPEGVNLPLEKIMEIIEVLYPEDYKEFQKHFRGTMGNKLHPDNETNELRKALLAVDEGILSLENEYQKANKEYKKHAIRGLSGGAVALALYSAGVPVAPYIAAAFSGSSLSSMVSFVPPSVAIPEQIKTSPFFIPWLIEKHKTRSL